MWCMITTFAPIKDSLNWVNVVHNWAQSFPMSTLQICFFLSPRFVFVKISRTSLSPLIDMSSGCRSLYVFEDFYTPLVIPLMNTICDSVSHLQRVAHHHGSPAEERLISLSVANLLEALDSIYPRRLANPICSSHWVSWSYTGNSTCVYFFSSSHFSTECLINISNPFFI